MLHWQADNTRLFGDRKDAITRFDIVRRHLMAAWSDPVQHDRRDLEGIDVQLHL